MNKSVCYLCELVWSLAMIIGCAFLVFWKGHSGWWFLLAVLLASGWNCNKSAAQT